MTHLEIQTERLENSELNFIRDKSNNLKSTRTNM